jgi:VanZ family protein
MANAPSAVNPTFRYAKLWMGLGLFIVFMILYLSLERGEKLPSVPGGDKLHHFIAYGTLMGWWAQIFVRQRLLVAIACVGLGVLIEFLQPMVSNRYFELLDIVADVVGVGIGWLCMFTPLRETLAWVDKKLP